MEICCVEDCGPYTVRPVLVAPRCADAPVECFPCLPHCTKTVYCCEKPKSKQQDSTYRDGSQPKCREEGQRSQHTMQRVPCSPPNNHQDCCYVRSSPPRPSCSEQDCKPIKTKYIIPCYRYEDGRIANQPTVLMRRACEVAVGKRPRKKPYVESSFIQEGDQQESRYIREDDEGNCCYHFEKQRTDSGSSRKPLAGCSSCPQYCMENPPCVTSRREPSPPPPQTCYYSYVPCYPC